MGRIAFQSKLFHRFLGRELDPRDTQALLYSHNGLRGAVQLGFDYKVQVSCLFSVAKNTQKANRVLPPLPFPSLPTV
uniref:Uncharacterized protein n=1 Tax=Anguilla anguilla TaxID=7936 RepID=A0A0E9V764_ANGAN